MLFVVGGQIGDVLIAQAVGNAAHGGVLALAFFVGIERSHDVLGILARDHGHLVHLGEAGLVAGDAVTTDAHGDLLLGGLGVTLDFLGLDGKSRHTRDSQGDDRGQQLVHFAWTIQRD